MTRVMVELIQNWQCAERVLPPIRAVRNWKIIKTIKWNFVCAYGRMHNLTSILNCCNRFWQILNRIWTQSSSIGCKGLIIIIIIIVLASKRQKWATISSRIIKFRKLATQKWGIGNAVRQNSFFSAINTKSFGSWFFPMYDVTS